MTGKKAEFDVLTCLSKGVEHVKVQSQRLLPLGFVLKAAHGVDREVVVIDEDHHLLFVEVSDALNEVDHLLAQVGA